jgi:hypothetical protein
MASFFSLFHCDSYASNRSYEDRFQWFAICENVKGRPQLIPPTVLEKLVARATATPSDNATLVSLARGPVPSRKSS